MASASEHEDDELFDPDQDPEEKRRVRKGYRTLQKYAEEKQTTDITAEELAGRVRQADELFRRVRGPQEATLDSDFLMRASAMGAQKARLMKAGGSAFDLDDFIDKLVQYMGGQQAPRQQQLNDEDEDDVFFDEDAESEPLEWEKIGRRAVAKSLRVPAMEFMLGPLSIEHKTRGPIKRARLEKNKDEERKPQELTEDDVQRSANETTKNVKHIADILEKKTVETGSINFFQFVINPHDFAQSVENIFYLSFLVRDGKCALEINDDGEPVIFSCEPPDDDQKKEGLSKRQIVMEFDMATWKKAIDVFNIQTSTIPQREAAKTRLGNKWYG